jgi:hypothetical protein
MFIFIALLSLLWLDLPVFLDILGLESFGVCIGRDLLFLIFSFRMIINGSSGRGSTTNFTWIYSSMGYDYARSCLQGFISSSIFSIFE